jgi:hypothetical protein
MVGSWGPGRRFARTVSPGRRPVNLLDGLPAAPDVRQWRRCDAPGRAGRASYETDVFDAAGDFEQFVDGGGRGLVLWRGAWI